MPTEEARRYQDHHPERRHCHEHGDRCKAHEDLTDSVGEVRDEVLEIRATRRTEKYFYGVIGTFILLIVSACGWVFKDNLSVIRTELTTIKAYSQTNAVSSERMQTEITSLKERIEKLEAVK